MATLLNQANRGPGTFASASANVPANFEGRSVQISAILQPGTLSNPAVTFGMYVEWFDPVASVWKFLVGSHDFWCGRLDKNGQPLVPSAQYTIPSWLVGKQVRGVLDLPNTINIGVDGSFV